MSCGFWKMKPNERLRRRGPLIVAQRPSGLALEKNLAGGRFQQQTEQRKQGGLAAA